MLANRCLQKQVKILPNLIYDRNSVMHISVVFLSVYKAHSFTIFIFKFKISFGTFITSIIDTVFVLWSLHLTALKTACHDPLHFMKDSVDICREATTEVSVNVHKHLVKM